MIYILLPLRVAPESQATTINEMDKLESRRAAQAPKKFTQTTQLSGATFLLLLLSRQWDQMKDLYEGRESKCFDLDTQEK